MKMLSELFEIRYGHSLELDRLTIASRSKGISFVSRQRKNNGVAAYVKPIRGISPNDPGELTCALNGQGGVMATFLQERPYYTSFHVACLRPRTEMTNGQKLYYCECLWANHYRYSWGRMANRTLKSILVPSLDDVPEWAAEVSANPFLGRDRPTSTLPPEPLNVTEWLPFRLSSLFGIRKGKRLTKANMAPGNTPFLGAIDSNNGLVCRVGQAPLHPANTMTVNYNGNGVAEAFYQPVPYRCTDDMNVLYPKFTMTPATAMFLATVIRQEKYRFSYGRKWHLDRMAESSISLPATATGEPDFDFMERYIKTLPFSSQL